jgi:hypothetical protein
LDTETWKLNKKTTLRARRSIITLVMNPKKILT